MYYNIIFLKIKVLSDLFVKIILNIFSVKSILVSITLFSMILSALIFKKASLIFTFKTKTFIDSKAVFLFTTTENNAKITIDIYKKQVKK